MDQRQRRSASAATGLADDRQRLVLDDDALERVLGDVAVARDDDADRLADVADARRRRRRRTAMPVAERRRERPRELARRRPASATPITPSSASAPETSSDADPGVRERSSAGSRRAAVFGSGSRSSMNQPRPRSSASSSTRWQPRCRPTARAAAAPPAASSSCPPSFRDDKRVPLGGTRAGCRRIGVRVSWTRAAGRNAERPLERRPGPAAARRAGRARAARRDRARQPPGHREGDGVPPRAHAAGARLRRAERRLDVPPGPALPDAGDGRAREPRPAPRPRCPCWRRCTRRPTRPCS